MEIILDGRNLTDRASVHDFFATALQLPDYYGRNLDALYDLLSAWPERVAIKVIYPDSMVENLGKYSNALLKTLQDAAESNPKIIFINSCEKTKNNT